MTAPDTDTKRADAPAMVLACVTGVSAAQRPAAAWCAALAPEVELRLADADAFPIASGGGPVALLAVADAGFRAARLARSLLARGDGPAHLVLCGCSAPVPPPTPLTCRLTVFADVQEAGTAANWRASCTGEFTLRVLPDPAAVPPFGPVSPDLALALKEELGVWPY